MDAHDAIEETPIGDNAQVVTPSRVVPLSPRSGKPPPNAFPLGHRFGGDKVAGRRMALERALVGSVTRDDMRRIVKAQVRKALAGDTAAFRELMPHLVGRPGQRVEMTVTSTNANFTAFSALPQAELEALTKQLESAVKLLADAEQSDGTDRNKS